jgi:mono/diheme cytochrome c family protein
MDANDLRDLFGFIKTLPAVPGKVQGPDLHFPFNIRRGIGLWKLVFLDGEPLPPAPGKNAAWLRGRYLVEGPAHCAACHSPRNVAGGIVSDKRFSGAPDPEGHGYIPNITSSDTGIGYWSVHEIASYLTDGISPIGLPAGGSMTAVVANMAHLSSYDRTAMAEYVKSLPPIDQPNQGVPQPNRTTTIRMLPPSANKTPSPAAVLAVSAAIASQSKTLYAVSTKPIYIDKPGAAAGPGDGTLLPAAQVEVLGQDGEWLHVKIDGWQQQTADASLTTLEGQRILVATLDPAALARMSHGEPVKDAGTGLMWAQGSLTRWVSKTDMNPSLVALWTYAGGLYGSTCSSCHSLHPADSYLANQWIGNLKAMKRFTSLDDGQYRLILAYLQLHSKDGGPAEAAAVGQAHGGKKL